MKKFIFTVLAVGFVSNLALAMPGDIPSSWGLQCQINRTGVEAVISLLDSLDSGRAELYGVDSRLSGLSTQKTSTVLLENDRNTQFCIDYSIANAPTATLCGENITAALASSSLNFKISELVQKNPNVKIGNLKISQGQPTRRSVDFTACVLRSNKKAESISNYFQSSVPVVREEVKLRRGILVD